MNWVVRFYIYKQFIVIVRLWLQIRNVCLKMCEWMSMEFLILDIANFYFWNNKQLADLLTDWLTDWLTEFMNEWMNEILTLPYKMWSFMVIESRKNCLK